VGTASFYHRSLEGHRTASGEPYDRRRLTAAHRTLPFGSRVRVTNLENGLSVVVLVNDRGPFRKGRVIDVSEEAARELGFYRAGTARVRVEELASRE
jgi:rare lipoprotein A